MATSFRQSALIGVTAGLAFLLFANHFLSPPDCASYWAWGESIIRTFSFNFEDSYARLEMPTIYVYLTQTERLSNDWPMGTGLLLAPFTLAPLAFGHAWVLLVAVVAVVYWWRRLDVPISAKRWALGSIVLGTPLAFYGLYGPFFSHVPSFALTTVFLVYWDKSRSDTGAGRWFSLGVLLGLCGLVRPQNLFLAIVLLTEIRRLNVARVATVAAGITLGFAPQMIVYWRLYGSALALPKIEEMNWFRPAIWKTLFSDFHGVIPWTPLYAMFPVGLAAMWKKDRQLALGLGLVLAVQLYLNAANFVWWSGGSFGNRRLTDNAIVLGYMVAALVGGSEGRQRRLVLGTIAACCAWTVLLMLAERRGIVPLDRYVSFRTKAFWSNLGRVIIEPIETIAAMFRPLLEGHLLSRVCGALLFGLGTAVLVRRKGRASGSYRVVLAGMAAILVALTAVAAARTPMVTDPELRVQLAKRSRMLWDNYVELAFYEIEQKDYEAAVAAAEKAIAIRPDHYSGWWYKGMALMRAEQWMPAAETFGTVKRLNPEHARAGQLQEHCIEQGLLGSGKAN